MHAKDGRSCRLVPDDFRPKKVFQSLSCTGIATSPLWFPLKVPDSTFCRRPDPAVAILHTLSHFRVSAFEASQLTKYTNLPPNFTTDFRRASPFERSSPAHTFQNSLQYLIFYRSVGQEPEARVSRTCLLIHSTTPSRHARASEISTTQPSFSPSWI